MLNRREFLGSAALATVAAKLAPASPGGPWKISMYQGSLRMNDPGVFELAKRIGLDGVEPLMGSVKDGLALRKADVRRQYKEASARTGVAISSVCISVLNSVPLKSEPKTALWLLDTIEACRDFGCKNILVPFFGKGELKMDAAEEIERTVDVLKELGPRAAAAGITLGLENTLSAEDNIALVDRIAAPGVAVYYDVGNSFGKGRDVTAEIRKLGKRICQIHLKDGPSLLGQGKIDFTAVAAAIRDIEYRGWLVLETSSPSGNVENDTRTNVGYVRKLFGIA